MHELLGGRPGRLLDVACGSGRHAREFAALGWEVTGVDYSPDLLERAREARHRGRTSRTCGARRARARRSTRSPACSTRSATRRTTTASSPRSAGMRRHLAPGGRVAVEFLHAPALLADADPVRVRRFELPDGGTLAAHLGDRRSTRRRASCTWTTRWSSCAPTAAYRRETRAPVEPLLRRRGDARADGSSPGCGWSASCRRTRTGEIGADTFHVIALAEAA